MLTAWTRESSFASMALSRSGADKLGLVDAEPDMPIARRRVKTPRSRLATRLDRPVAGLPLLDFMPVFGLF